MHPRDRTQRVVTAVALVISAAAFAVVLRVSGFSLAVAGAFLAFVLVAWALAAFLGAWVARRLVERESPQVSSSTPSSTPSPLSPESSAPSLPNVPYPSLRPESDFASELGSFEMVEAAPQPSSPSSLPASIAPGDVLEALVRAGETLGDVVSAGLWLEDPPTASLRLVRGAGRVPPADTPLSTEEGPAAEALEAGLGVWGEAADITDRDGRVRVWRLVQPVDAGTARGLVTVDISPSRELALSDVTQATRHLRSSLAGALALHVAEQEARTARELIEGARELSRCLEPDAVLDVALARAVEMASGQTGSVMLADGDGVLSIVRSVGLPDEIVAGTTVRPGEGIAGWVFANGQPLLVEDLPSSTGSAHRRGVRSAVSVPIADEDGTIGVLSVASREFPARFTKNHMDAIEVLGRQACVAYQNALAVDTTRDLYLATLRTLAIAMETKDPYSRGATERVLDYVVALGSRMDLDEETMTSLEVAALFHDMGMSAAGDAVVRENRPLTTVERGLVKMHPVIAADVLADAPALRNVAPIVFHHHERFDGRGYVGGLSGEAIPIAARVLSVVDGYVAMTSTRPYRAAMSRAEAIRELQAHAGTQFDPDVVVEFVEMLGQEESRSRERTD